MSLVYLTRQCRHKRKLRMYKHLCKARGGAFASRLEPLCDKVAGRFSQVATSGVMKFLSLVRRNVLKTGKYSVALKDRRDIAVGTGNKE